MKELIQTKIKTNNPTFNSVGFHRIKTNENPYDRLIMTSARYLKNVNTTSQKGGKE